MEMPGINLAHADLKKYNQAPNHLYIYIYIYIYTYGISRKPLKLCQQKTENIIYFHLDFNFA